MMTFDFSRDKSANIVASLQQGRPLTPTDRGTWSDSDLLMTGAACLFHLLYLTGQKNLPYDQPWERREATLDTNEHLGMRALRSALSLTLAVQHGSYDQKYLSDVRLVVEIKDGEPVARVTPLED